MGRQILQVHCVCVSVPVCVRYTERERENNKSKSKLIHSLMCLTATRIYHGLFSLPLLCCPFAIERRPARQPFTVDGCYWHCHYFCPEPGTTTITAIHHHLQLVRCLHPAAAAIAIRRECAQQQQPQKQKKHGPQILSHCLSLSTSACPHPSFLHFCGTP